MQGLELIDSHTWSLSNVIPGAHPFFTFNTHTIYNTWFAMLILTVFLWIGRITLYNKKSLGRYAIKYALQALLDVYNQAFTTYSPIHFTFITTIFLFIFFCNSISLIPWTEEPTTDLNTALSLGVVSFLYAQITAIKNHGFKEYILGYFQPFFVFFPLNIVSKIASIISISFRLFGNIFGGAIIAKLYTSAISGVIIFEIFGIISTVNLVIALFFGLFEGFLQAFVFTMLTTTTIALAVQGENH